MKKSISIFLLLSFIGATLPARPLRAEQKSLSESAPSDLDLQPSQKEVESQSLETQKKWGFREIPRDLGLSMKESFVSWGALGFGLGIGLTLSLHPLDDDIADNIQEGEIFGNTGDKIIGWTLSPYTIFGVSVITFLATHYTDHPKLATTTLALSEALFLSLGVDAIGKVAFRRTRPDGGNFSFPSAHATAAFTAAGVLTTFYGWKAGLPSYALASLVSVARIDDREHFLSDVVMGAVIGTVIGVGTAQFHKKENPNFFFTGNASRERATIGITFIY